MKRIFLIMAVLALAGCANVYKYVPSFWDDNQSRAAVDIQASVAALDCEAAWSAQAQEVKRQVDWIMLYSKSKGRSQQDIIKLYEPMKETADDFARRTQASKTYCQLKKRILTEQAQRAAGSVLGRW